MARTPASSTVRIGGIAECGFVFRDKTKALTAMTAINFEVFIAGVSSETFTQADSRVTLGATLGTDLAVDLGLSTAENAAGVGIVSVEITPGTVGAWAVYADGVTPIADAATAKFTCIAKSD